MRIRRTIIIPAILALSAVGSIAASAIPASASVGQSHVVMSNVTSNPDTVWVHG